MTTTTKGIEEQETGTLPPLESTTTTAAAPRRTPGASPPRTSHLSTVAPIASPSRREPHDHAPTEPPPTHRRASAQRRRSA
ncbi:proline-rich receptor-like protein kinase PERK9 [Iris pallida]|uniref:Proline-rich receptor-like protein kinase PERK9 n=1 Tax=Iris pallida TaxID=29817 RepID=A0AAX6DKV7_IRIPA|nr:proline-rich receptor-like protein kinase PERK9 [Iris pallida]